MIGSFWVMANDLTTSVDFRAGAQTVSPLMKHCGFQKTMRIFRSRCENFRRGCEIVLDFQKWPRKFGFELALEYGV